MNTKTDKHIVMRLINSERFTTSALIASCTAVALAVLLASCGSSKSSVDVSGVQQAEQAAVPIIIVNKEIDMSDLQDGGDLLGGDGAAGFVQRLLDDEAFDLSPMAELLRDKTFNVYADRLPATVLPEDQVIRTERYENFSLLDNESSDDRMQRFNGLVAPDGYKRYRLGGQGDAIVSRQQNMFDAVPDGTDALLFISADYEAVEDSPAFYSFIPFVDVDRAYIEATVRIEMMDESGDTIMKVQQVALSDGHLNTIGGLSMNPDKIQQLCIESTEAAVAKTDQVIQQELEG